MKVLWISKGKRCHKRTTSHSPMHTQTYIPNPIYGIVITILSFKGRCIIPFSSSVVVQLWDGKSLSKLSVANFKSSSVSQDHRPLLIEVNLNRSCMVQVQRERGYILCIFLAASGDTTFNPACKYGFILICSIWKQDDTLLESNTSSSYPA